MPHLKEKGEEEKKKTDRDERDGTEICTTEEKKKVAGDMLLTLAENASSIETPSSKGDKNRDDESTTAEQSFTDPKDPVERTHVTPSPYGVGHHRSYEHLPYYGYEGHPPPYMSAYEHSRGINMYDPGARQLFPSPARNARMVSNEEIESEVHKHTDQHGHHFQESSRQKFQTLGKFQQHYYRGYEQHSTSLEDKDTKSLEKHRNESRKRELENKEELTSSKEIDDSKGNNITDKEGEESKPDVLSMKRRKISEPSTQGKDGQGKQRIISPTSSIEGPQGCRPVDNEDVSKTAGKSPKIDTNNEQYSAPRHPAAQQDARYGSMYPYHHHQYYPSRPIMYSYPPPPPPPHYHPHQAIPHPPHPPHPYQGPPHHVRPHHPAWRYSHPYPHGPLPTYASPYGKHGHQQQSYKYETTIDRERAMNNSSRDTRDKKSILPDKSSSSTIQTLKSKLQKPSENKITSVADWQKAALATGKAPSANRCVQLKGPIPSKYWGETDKAMETPMPDFHQLVNFPDYLNKLRSGGSDLQSASKNGKRPCVMCGKLRICSASTANLGGSGLRRGKKGEEDDADGSDHIIPRQNKGLCTACDVTVWVVVDTGLEIKWCKGCKNFRPWAAFGDKGLATKCVRCRDRQREKYAMQKDELRLRRLRQSNSKKEKKITSKQHEIDAAKGLRDLMTATSHV